MRRTVLLAVFGLLAVLFVSPSPASAFSDRDCSDFDTHREAQTFFKNNNPSSDPHGLDSDGDGRACETLPCPCGVRSGGTGGGKTGTKKKTIIERGRVTRVVDGDTVKVRLRSGARRTVRLIGIDTPEVYGGRECGGPRASRALKRLLPNGTRVGLRSDPTQARSDRYGRTLRYVTKSASGVDAAKWQLRQGWARVYVYGGKPFKRTGIYRAAQRNAKAHKRGVWRICR